MMTSKTVMVASLKPNPYRDYERNPPSEERIQGLMDSIERNDLWRGIVVRPAIKGYELAFGHHRLEAIKRLGIKKIDVDVADLSDAQMLQYLSDENLNQGGKSPAAVREIVVQAIFLLEGYLAEAETPEQFCEWANIESAAGGTFDSQTWATLKNSGTVGRRVLRAFLSSENHSAGWSNENIQLGINVVKSERAYEEAKAEKEAAQKEFEAKVGKVSKSEQDAIDARLAEAEANRKEKERFAGYVEIAEMFPHVENAAIFVRELKTHYPSMPKSDQMRFASKVVQDGTGKRDIPRVLGELVKGKADWEKEEKRRQKKRDQDAKKRRDNWKARWEKTHDMTPDQYVRENLGLLNQMDTFLDTLRDVFDHIEDEELQQTFLIAAAKTRDALNDYVGGLSADQFIDIN